MTTVELVDQGINDGILTPIENVARGKPAKMSSTYQKYIFIINLYDQDIALLVLAAGDSKEGPGPLVSSLGDSSNSFSIPVVVVPCEMTFEDIENVT